VPRKRFLFVLVGVLILGPNENVNRHFNVHEELLTTPIR